MKFLPFTLSCKLHMDRECVRITFPLYLIDLSILLDTLSGKADL